MDCIAYCYNWIVHRFIQFANVYLDTEEYSDGEASDQGSDQGSDLEPDMDLPVSPTVSSK